MTRTAQENSIVDELTFRNYAHNRMLSPHITPEQWALIYSNVPEMEERYKLASTGNILDVAPQGENDSRSECPHSAVGVLNTGEGVGTASHKCSGKAVHGLSGRATDSQISSPLYLLASEIVDVVEFAAQYRAEEEAAAEEGALIEASGYNDPATNPRFA